MEFKIHLKDVKTRALPFYSLQKQCFLSGIAQITSPPNLPTPTPRTPQLFSNEKIPTLIFFMVPLLTEGGRLTKREGFQKLLDDGRET